MYSGRRFIIDCVYYARVEEVVALRLTDDLTNERDSKGI
jgi:hypothetical protein